MLVLLRVLVGSIARFLRGLAEALGRWAAPAPQAPPAWSPSPVSAPEDWVRRAVPPPPAHWLAVVRARAPHFQPSDPRAPRARQDLPPFSPVLRPVRPEGPAPPSLPRTPKLDAPALPLARSPIPTFQKFPAVTPRRVITVVEEQPSRPKRKSSPVESLPESPEPESAALTESPARLRRKDANPLAPEALPSMEALPEIASPDAKRTLPEDVDASPRPQHPPSVDTPLEPRSPWRSLPLPTPAMSRCTEERVLQRADPANSWPALPESAEDRPQDLCRALHREALLQDELVREQRGMPWSA